MLRVRLLGELELEGSNGPIELGGSWRARSVLAWLALHPGDHLRSELAPRFWPDVLDTSARASLRSSLWAIRQALGPDAGALVATRSRVGLAPDVETDVAEFRAHMEAGRLEEALALCRGELLAGFEEDWALDAQDAHRETVAGLLARLAEQAEAGGDAAEAIALSRRRLALDPLDESAARDLIERLARAGDRAGALAVHERIRERFRSELGISLSDETRQLVRKVREDGGAAGGPAGPADEGGTGPATAAGDWRPGSEFPLPPQLRRAARVPFVGREAELEELRGHWQDVCSGRGARLVLVAGEPGIGKSRLTREIALEAARGGGVVLYGSAGEEHLVLHQPLVMALGHYLGTAAGPEVERAVGAHGPDLAPVAPDLAVAAAEASPSSEGRRYRLFEAVGSVLERLAEPQPVLLVVDDVHWADQSTVAICRHVLETRPEMAMLVVATQRTVDAGAEGEIAEALARLARSDFTHRLELDGLAAADIGELAESLGRGLPAELVDGIQAETRGNPFFAAEIVSDLHERGGGLLDLSSGAVPAPIEEVLGRRLSRLSENCLKLLTVAAVMGTEFRVAPLGRVSGLGDEDLAAGLDEALAADILVEGAGTAEHESFSFSHALLRRTLLQRVSRAHQRRIHLRVAESLIAADGDATLLEIAHHLCEARPVSDREQAVDYAVRAAEQAVEGLAYAEAVDLLTRARSLLPEDDPRSRKLALKRAIAYQALFHAAVDGPAGA